MRKKNKTTQRARERAEMAELQSWDKVFDDVVKDGWAVSQEFNGETYYYAVDLTRLGEDLEAAIAEARAQLDEALKAGRIYQ
jgi:hypothetical protein